MRDLVEWMLRLLPVATALVPATILAAMPEERDGASERARAERRLWLATLACLLLHAAVQTALDVWDAGSAVRVLWSVGFGGQAPVVLFLLWGRPAMTAPGSAWNLPVVRGRVRGASLFPRHRHDPVPRRVWVAGWVMFVAATAVGAWATPELDGLAALSLAALLTWPVTVVAARATLLEPEPIAPDSLPTCRRPGPSCADARCGCS